MTEKKVFTAHMPDRANAEASYAAAALTVATALKDVLTKERDARGADALEWFEALEKRLIRDAKGAVTEGIPIQVEAPALQYGVDVLQALLDSVRHGIVSREDKD